jgi:hypothetical protein
MRELLVYSKACLFILYQTIVPSACKLESTSSLGLTKLSTDFSDSYRNQSRTHPRKLSSNSKSR